MAKYLDSTGLARVWTNIKSVVGLKVINTSQRKINTQAATSNGITFTGGTNKFTVSDGSSSFDVPITPSLSLNTYRLYFYAADTGSVYYDPIAGGNSSGKSSVLLLSGDATANGISEYNSGSYRQIELSVQVSKIKLLSSSGTGWYAVPIGSQVNNMSSGKSIGLYYSTSIAVQASTGDIRIGSKYVTKSSTQGLSIEVVSSMPSSPNSNTIYIVV